ncbi:6-phosphate N-acetyltransferase [Tupanvirus soda lake]|uniref:glucosamine-phosphate N-acetyltransferase n=2 Tax=Tupanvirus TaxID=2094720 RepID=A0A6N1NR44_9VIRU|nr:6-phosphate N-acetyltransferase [Tupanvirus soda lake]QKU35067.1 6-phosphate N-acetyltransferase [Tupanvirus soda lake]
MDIKIEELSIVDDYQQYCELLKQLTAINPELITKEKFKKQLAIITSNPFHKILVAKYEGNIVGTTTVLIEPKIIHDLSRVAHIEDVVVDTNYRSYGVGSLLIKKAIEISKSFDCYKVILDCSEKNIGFYEKFGFKRKEIQMALYLEN